MIRVVAKFKPGGRLCPSHYCKPPEFKKLSTPLMIKTKIDCTFRISQTAPASPTIGRSRATSSSVPSGPGGQVDLDNHTFSESSAAASVGHLGEKVKKTIKQVKKFVEYLGSFNLV